MKLQRTFVREEAYALLLSWIVEGKLEPGKKLRDKDLAEQLGVSRTPIREALLRLEDDGLVQTRANSATLVSPIDLENVFQLYSVVWSLEKLALEQAFPHLTPDHIGEMDKCNRKLKESLEKNNRLAAVKADNDFHAVYIDLSGNAELRQILLSVKQKLTRIELYYFEKARDAKFSIKEHQAIIAALKKKDLAAALNAVESNWKSSLTRIKTV